jgi:glycosyltransferase involved in cell wall biosynthesis
MLNHNVVWRSTFYRAFYLGRELALRGHDVTVATISRDRLLRPREHVVEGVRVVETPDVGVSLARTGWDPWDTVWRCARFAKERFDVVHGFDCRPVVLGASLWLQRRGVPWVSDWADWWGRGGAIAHRKSWIGRVAFRDVETWLEEAFRDRADAVTVTSRALAERARGLGVDGARVHYVPSGANVRTIAVRDMGECRRELSLPADVPIACFVGWVQYDLDLAIRAFAVARERIPQARLLLVGPRNRDATRLVAEKGLEGAVHEYGPQPFERVPTFLGASDVLLLPLSDNLMNRARGPIKLGDYMAAGRATLANPVGDVVDVFGADGGAGLLAGDTPEAYGSALADLLADRERCAALGRSARRLAETRYSWSHMADPLERIYITAAGAN